MAMASSRKVFQIIVDDTAFTTNISEIKKWLAHGAIIIVVPLYSEPASDSEELTIPANIFSLSSPGVSSLLEERLVADWH